MNTPTPLLIILDLTFLIVVGALASSAIRSVQRRAEREQSRHERIEAAFAIEREATREAHAEQLRELHQTIAFLGQRTGPPQAWAAPQLDEFRALGDRIASPEEVILSPVEIPIPYEQDVAGDYIPEAPETNGRSL